MNFPTLLEWRTAPNRDVLSIPRNNPTLIELLSNHIKEDLIADQFYSRPLVFEDLITCDEEGRVITHPQASDYMDVDEIEYSKASTAYCDAEEKVPFKGFKYNGRGFCNIREDNYRMACRDNLRVTIYSSGAVHVGNYGREQTLVTSIDEFLNHPDVKEIEAAGLVVKLLNLEA